MVTSPSSPVPPNMRFVDPPGLARIARLELVARTAVEGLLSGLHPSPFFGSSVEYADHRPYTQSDELRNVDWKQLAKTDKLFVKLFEEQTNTRITVILDTSKSMDFSGTDGGITKLDYGRFLAAGLCHLALKQNDAAGLATFDSQMRAYVPPRRQGRRRRSEPRFANSRGGFRSAASSYSSVTCWMIPAQSARRSPCSSTNGTIWWCFI